MIILELMTGNVVKWGRSSYVCHTKQERTTCALWGIGIVECV